MKQITAITAIIAAGYLANLYAMQAAFTLLHWIPSLSVVMEASDPWPAYLTGAIALFLTACVLWRYVLMPLLEHLPIWLLAQMSKGRAVRTQETTDKEGMRIIQFTLRHVTPKRKAFFAGTLSIAAIGIIALGYGFLNDRSVLSAATLATAAGLAARLMQGAFFLRRCTVLSFGPDAQWYFEEENFDLWSSQFAIVDHDRAMDEAYSEKESTAGDGLSHKYREAVQLVAYTPSRVDIGEFSDRREAEDSLLALMEARSVILEQHGMQPSFG